MSSLKLKKKLYRDLTSAKKKQNKKTTFFPLTSQGKGSSSMREDKNKRAEQKQNHNNLSISTTTDSKHTRRHVGGVRNRRRVSKARERKGRGGGLWNSFKSERQVQQQQGEGRV